MNLGRIFRHLLSMDLAVKRAFPAASLRVIEQTIRECETRHQGEIRFAVEAALDIQPLLHGEGARERAIEVFSQLRVWDTENNNGVLIYLLLADHDVEIIADRGIHRYVGEQGWAAICYTMEQAFRQGRFEAGVVSGIQAISALLERYFPAQARNPNELPDEPVLL
jgi:uncharacterized membrane protein